MHTFPSFGSAIYTTGVHESLSDHRNARVHVEDEVRVLDDVDPVAQRQAETSSTMVRDSCVTAGRDVHGSSPRHLKCTNNAT